MPSYIDKLTPKVVNIENVLLDPNNPRFAELDNAFREVPEARFNEPKIQSKSMDILKKNFDVEELRDTIKELGFLPMDRIVVREWKGDSTEKKYVVIEGNRRVTALKWLLERNETGLETLSPEQITNFTNIEVLILESANVSEMASLILPGLRHISGIKQWGPYQKGRLINVLREAGKEPKEAAQSVGLGAVEANRLWRCFWALHQMHDDEEYGEYAEPKKFSYFEEIFKNPKLRDWLDWNDTHKRFLNDSNLNEFYGWMIKADEEEGETAIHKLPEAKSVRQLAKIIDNPDAMRIFRSANGDLSAALSKVEAQQKQVFQPTLIEAEATLANLSPDNLRTLSEEDLEIINALSKRIAQVLEDRLNLLKTNE